MLFVLTGDIQTGKTRWLEHTIARLEAHGIPVYGVIAPGVWIPREQGDACDTGGGASGRYEKTGINNVLLPSHERIVFASRNDAALRNKDDLGDQALSGGKPAKPKLWEINPTAVDQVNAHFDTLEAAAETATPGLLVIDEFGQLELFYDDGITSAVRLIERGARPAFSHALVIIREQFLDAGMQRFKDAPWGSISAITPGDEAETTLLTAFGLES